jgi:hypothetical protein
MQNGKEEDKEEQLQFVYEILFSSSIIIDQNYTVGILSSILVLDYISLLLQEVWIVLVRCVLISYVNLMSQCYQTSCYTYSKYTVLLMAV